MITTGWNLFPSFGPTSILLTWNVFSSAAGNAFSQAALLHLQMQSKHDAATNFIDAGNAFKKADPHGNDHASPPSGYVTAAAQL